MKKVIVLGGTGFVGRSVCEKLVGHGHRVTVATRDSSRAKPLLHLHGLAVREFDVHDESALTGELRGFDAVVNLIAILHGDRAAFEHTHVALPGKIARACRQAGSGTLVHVSALGVDGMNPGAAPSNYLRSKGFGERALRTGVEQSGIALTMLRPSVIFGAGDKFLTMFALLQKMLPVMPLAGAEARFQPVWVEDVALAVLRSLDANPGGPAPLESTRIIEACGPDVFALRELVQLSAQLSGVRKGRGRPVVDLPDWAARMQAQLMEWLPGDPLMSRDNLDSMKVDNVATGKVPGLESLDIKPASLRPIAAQYLQRKLATT